MEGEALVITRLGEGQDQPLGTAWTQPFGHPQHVDALLSVPRRRHRKPSLPISAPDRITIRAATDDDFEAIIGLGVRCLGWNGDQRDRDFFRWKHQNNPFGRSPAWVAESGGQVVGFRTFLRWRFVHGTTNETLEMVRAVDTATDPDFQGQGIFRELTMSAVEELTAMGIDAVFNTPNDKSRPGYLKMGWRELGRPTVRIRLLGLKGITRIAGARAPAKLWPENSSPRAGQPVGVLPEHVLAPRPTWRTERTEEFRSWRYAFSPLGYRQTTSARGGSVYRPRRRGKAIEISLCEVHGTSPGLGPDVRSQGDYSLALGDTKGMLAVPIPNQGPVVTWRPLRNDVEVSLTDLDLILSDVELF